MSTAVVAAFLASPALAQAKEPKTGSLVPSTPSGSVPDRLGLTDETRGRMAVESFAECLVAKRADEVKAYVRLKHGSEGIKKLGQLIEKNSSCLAYGTTRIHQNTLRGAVFRALYLKENGRDKLALSGKVFPFAEHVDDAQSESGKVYLTLMEFGSCVVRSDPEAAKDFLLAEPDSAAETKALGALSSKFGSCFPQGPQATLSKSVLSAVLAEAAYREAEMGKAGPAAVSGKQ
ncbi:hypothetical protein [Sphingobium lignivorans]|uniref:Uncharacterized protein n=1 Tax=Sphingobium lignivorans TaxID=2735886 RepID=A0ABR6NG26_9SPHN|nr:hypothetical protein [Sphingobium lignivorans]MBB5986225.1 hypothetical protein [Sphingobium lignivorans]